MKYLSLMILFLSISCLSKKENDKADCGARGVFDALTRTCLDGPNTAPAATLTSVSIFEDSYDNIVQLKFNDFDGDIGVSCNVSDLSAFIELAAPTNALSLAEAGLIKTKAGTIVVNFPLGLPADLALIQAAKTNLDAALDASQIAHDERNHAAFVGNMQTFLNEAEAIVTIALRTTIQPQIVVLGSELNEQLGPLKNLVTSAGNRCHCSGGVCETSLSSISEHFFGSEQFSYTISDLANGASPSQIVEVNVLAINDKPIPISQSMTALESSNQTGNTSAFVLGLARDVEDDLISSLFTYTLQTAPTQGTLSNCMGLNGSAVNDRLCDYTPNDGDATGSGATASVIINDLTFFAKSDGAYGNDLQVEIRHQSNLGPSPKVEISYPSGKVKMTITIEDGVTTTDDIKTVIDNDLEASSYFDVVNNLAASPQNIFNSVDLAGGSNGLDTFTYSVHDGSDESERSATVNINITAVNDPPRNDLVAMGTVLMTEDTQSAIDLKYYDPEGDLAIGCTVTNLVNLQEVIPCLCDIAGVCTAQLIPTSNYTGTASFEYTVNNATPATSTSTVVPVVVSSSNDRPIASVHTVAFTESISSAPQTVAFTIDPPYDADSAAFTYTIITSPVQGVLANCLGLNGSANNDLVCDYTPLDGNINGVGATASLIFQGLTYTSKVGGTFGNGISIQYVDGGPGFAGSETVSVVNKAIEVKIEAGVTTTNQIKALIDADPIASKLVDITINAAIDPEFAQAATLLAGGVAGFDRLVYRVNDGIDDNIYDGEIHFDVTPVNDTPEICAYSPFTQAPECGLLGCTGTASPLGVITPSQTDLIYYQSSSAICYKSVGLTSSDWQIITDPNDLISDQMINEKDIVLIDSVVVDEGGGDAAEDTELIRIQAVTSSNPVLIPTNNVKFYFDGTAYATGVYFGGATSEDTGDFRIEITPVSGQNGSSTISLTIQDSAGSSTVATFVVTVNNTSAIHNGWKKISALGPATDKFDQLVSAPKTCTYSRTKCNGGSSCQGSGAPTTVTPDQSLSIYHDTAADACYFSNSTTTGDWTQVTSLSCNISDSDLATECTGLGASCIGSGAPGVTPTKLNHFYYDQANNVCYRSNGTSSSADWETYSATAEVTLGWESFSVSGPGSITGFNVYRRLANEFFDFTAPINKSTIGVSSSEYIDDATNSYEAPVPNTVYYYEVRPIINSVATSTSEVFKTVRATVPDDNQAFVHRWIVNKSMCTLMQALDTDPNSNFRCSFEGPGDTGLAAGSNYYDIGSDLIVDRHENGCPYTAAPACSGTSDGSCVGLSDPGGVVSASFGDIYYSRSTGKCFVNQVGTTWQEVNGATTLSRLNRRKLPPLVHVSQEDAHNICRARTQTSILGTNATPVVMKLPSRKEQQAYSSWNTNTTTDSTILTLETGLSLNSTSKCNTSSANGLSANYSDNDAPDSNTFYTLPGSKTSNIRSLMTGSTQTQSCQTRYGLQDVVGNVSEWLVDRMSCDDAFSCSSVIAGEALALTDANNDLRPGLGADVFDRYRLDGAIGPCIDIEPDGICDSSLTSWIIDEESFNANRYIIPLGLPTHSQFVILNPTSETVPYLKEIGPTNGITANQLHDDDLEFNLQNVIEQEANNCAALVSGGSYLSANGAGQFHLETVPCVDTEHLSFSGITIKSKTPGGSPAIQVQIYDPGANPVEIVTANAGTGLIQVDLRDGGSTGAQIRAAINGDVTAASMVSVTRTGDETQVVAIQGPTTLTNVTETSKRVDIGFRCVAPLDTYLE